MNNYPIEKNKLLEHLADKDLITLLREAKCIIAGGAITSLFSGREINDIDVYFHDYKSLNMVLQNLFNVAEDDDNCLPFLDTSPFTLIYTNHTKKSILFTKDKLNLQFIYFKFLPSSQAIFDTYDYTINMGAYDCGTEEFCLHPNFLKDIAQRRLNVNTNTSFPIMSLLRVDKYLKRGYQISKKEFVKLCLAANKLDFNTWEELYEAIGGMYGYTFDNLFDVAKPFSMDEAIQQLIDLETDLKPVYEVKETNYFDLIIKINTNLGISPEPDNGSYYKKVVRTSYPNIFTSYYHPTFTYTTNQISNGGQMGIWAYKSIAKAERHFCSGDKTKEAIIEIKLEPSAIAKRDDCSKSFNIIGNVKVIGEVSNSKPVAPTLASKPKPDLVEEFSKLFSDAKEGETFSTAPNSRGYDK
jgi:hypothetical protein